MRNSVNRRDFILAAGGAAVTLACRPAPKLDLPPEDPSRLIVKVKTPRTKIAAGITKLGVGSEDFSDGFIFVPISRAPSSESSAWRPAFI